MKKTTKNYTREIAKLLTQSGITQEQLQSLLISGRLTALLNEFAGRSQPRFDEDEPRINFPWEVAEFVAQQIEHWHLGVKRCQVLLDTGILQSAIYSFSGFRPGCDRSMVIRVPAVQYRSREDIWIDLPCVNGITHFLEVEPFVSSHLEREFVLVRFNWPIADDPDPAKAELKRPQFFQASPGEQRKLLRGRFFSLVDQGLERGLHEGNEGIQVKPQSLEPYEFFVV